MQTSFPKFMLVALAGFCSGYWFFSCISVSWRKPNAESWREQPPPPPASPGSWGWRFRTCTSNGSLSVILSDPLKRRQLAYGQNLLDAFAERGYCSNPSEGVFITSKSDNKPPRNSFCSNALGPAENGTWNTSTKWVPSSCPSYSWLTVVDVHNCLAGRHLMFQGNSLARQLFSRFISLIRGFEVSFDHFYHHHAAYVFSRAGDKLEISTGNDDSWLLKKVNSTVDPSDALILFRMYPGKLWEDVVQEHVDKTAAVVQNKGETGDFIVRWPNKSATQALEKHWMQEDISIDAMNDAGGAPHYYRRNILLMGSPGLKMEPPRGQKLYAHTEKIGWRQVEAYGDSDVHFQCGFEPMWPDPASRWKIPMNGDCRDILNLNVIQAFLNRICHS